MPPKTDPKQQIQAIFNDVATRYDANLFFTLSAEHLIRSANLDGSERMLDVCSGTGIIAIHAASRHPGLTVDAVDLSEEMLNQAARKAKALGVTNINFVACDVDKMDYAAASFDLITCGYGLFFFPNMEGSVGKIISTLKPGGKFVFSSFTAQAFKPFTEMFMADLQRYGIHTPDLMINRLQSPEKITALCNECGVTDVQIKTQEIRYKITPAGWWNLLNSAAYKGLIAQLPSDKLNRFKTEHLGAVSDLSKNGEIELVADSYYCTATPH